MSKFVRTDKALSTIKAITGAGYKVTNVVNNGQRANGGQVRIDFV